MITETRVVCKTGEWFMIYEIGKSAPPMNWKRILCVGDDSTAAAATTVLPHSHTSMC